MMVGQRRIMTLGIYNNKNKKNKKNNNNPNINDEN